MSKKIIKTVKISFVSAIFGFVFLCLGFSIVQINKSDTEKSNALISKSYALDTGVGIPNSSGGTTNSFPGGYQDYVKAVFSFSLKLGVALTVLMVIFAGYKYMTSQGNPTAINEAKDIIIGSLSGFIMLLLIYLILNVYNFGTP